MEATLEPQVLPVAPGERGAWTLHLRNPDGPGGEPAVCRLSLAGPAAEWSWLTAEEVTVPAGEEARVRVSVRLPPPPTPSAGRLPLEVRAGSEFLCTAQLDVLPVVDVTASLGRPDGRGVVPLTLRNRGNAPVTVSLSAESASVAPSSLAIKPGDVATASVSTRRGAEFTVHVQPEGGAVLDVEGASPGAARRHRRLWPAVVPVAIVALIGGALVASRGGSSGPAPDEQAEGTTIATAPPSPDCPARGHLARDPAGLPRRNVPIPDGYSFLDVRPGGCQPLRFNPCEPIHYVTNSALAPPGGMDDLQAAFQQLSQATGIEFVNDGPTDEPASLVRLPFQAERYGSRWAPILIVWDHGAPHQLQPTNPGGGRPIRLNDVYVSGFLILNVDAVNADRRPLPNGFGPGATWGRVMIHELGHLIGLGHVLTSREIMFEDLGLQTGQAEYHEGDLTGLRFVGREAGCVQTPPAPVRR